MPKGERYDKKERRDPEWPMQVTHHIVQECGELFDSHWQQQMEMHYVVQGCGDVHIDQQQYRIGPGDLLIVNRNALRAGYSTEAPYEAYRLMLDPADLSKEWGEVCCCYQPVIRGDAVVGALCDRLISEWSHRQEGYRPLCRGLILELLVHLHRHYVEKTESVKAVQKRRRDLERLTPALEYIEQHYAQRLSVSQLAAMLQLSSDRLGHLFRDGVGQAPLQYINEIRLRKAMHLLKTETCTGVEVAQAVGFFDYNHFGRQFRRRYGCTPNQVRRHTE